MARSDKSRQQELPVRRSRRRNTEETTHESVHPETKRWIAIVILLACAGISMLAFFNLAGAAGTAILYVVTLLFGQTKWLFPITLLVFAYYQITKREVGTLMYMGIFLFLFSLTGLVHVFIPLHEAVNSVREGIGAGYIGLFLSYGFQNVFGFWASLIALIALVCISLLLIGNASFSYDDGKKNIFQRFLEWLHIRWYDVNARMQESVEDDESAEEEAEEPETLRRAKTVLAEDAEVDEEEGEEVSFAKKVIAQTKERVAQKEREEIQLDEPKVKRAFKKVDLPLDLLDSRVGKPTAGNIALNKITIQKTLESFGISVEMGDVTVGPTVTQFTLKPAEGIKLTKITALADDLALALAAHPIRIEAPIPGKSLVGIEVPNQSVSTVRLRELLDSAQFKKRSSQLTLPIGKDVSGATWVAPLEKMPHLLVAGATGSGKSVCLNTIIISLLYQNGPDTLKFIMVDPKRVELPLYNDIPHLLTPVITDVKKTVNALKWATSEMDRRYELLQKMNRRNIESYNSVAEEKMPYIVIVVDEMADLMSQARNEVEGLIIRLAQMARAIGIHLILATQRPSVDVITGLIKANVPTRIAFAVASLTDSRTILDAAGAEKLVGKGDMLYVSADVGKPKRLQGAFLSEDEVKNVVNFLKEGGDKPEFDMSIVEKQATSNGATDFSDPDEGDPLFEDAKSIVIQAKKASTSFLQRRLKVGYSRAARLIDLLEEAGVVGPGEGAKPREILVTETEVDGDEEMLEQSDDMPVEAGVSEFEGENPDEYDPEVEENK